MFRTAYSLIPLVRSTFHQHKFHFSDVYGFCGNHSGRVFLKNDGLVFYESEQFTVELYAMPALAGSIRSESRQSYCAE